MPDRSPDKSESYLSGRSYPEYHTMNLDAREAYILIQRTILQVKE